MTAEWLTAKGVNVDEPICHQVLEGKFADVPNADEVVSSDARNVELMWQPRKHPWPFVLDAARTPEGWNLSNLLVGNESGERRLTRTTRRFIEIGCGWPHRARSSNH